MVYSTKLGKNPVRRGVKENNDAVETKWVYWWKCSKVLYLPKSRCRTKKMLVIVTEQILIDFLIIPNACNVIQLQFTRIEHLGTEVLTASLWSRSMMEGGLIEFINLLLLSPTHYNLSFSNVFGLLKSGQNRTKPEARFSPPCTVKQRPKDEVWVLPWEVAAQYSISGACAVGMYLKRWKRFGKDSRGNWNDGLVVRACKGNFHVRKGLI